MAYIRTCLPGLLSNSYQQQGFVCWFLLFGHKYSSGMQRDIFENKPAASISFSVIALFSDLLVGEYMHPTCVHYCGTGPFE
jgi:hypothetical protein